MTKEFVTLSREVLEQALEALREAQVLMERFQDEKLRRSAMEALRAALEQPQGEQEPVALLADAIRSEPTELIHKWRVLELIQDHVKQQPLDG